jgi:uncharacterized protein
MIRTVEGGASVEVLVQPRASRVKIGPVHGDRLKIAVTAPPVAGAANDAVVEALAAALGRPRRDVTISAGHSSRRKTVTICGASAADLEALCS